RRSRKSPGPSSLSRSRPPKPASAQPTQSQKPPQVLKAKGQAQKAERLQKLLAAAGLGSRRQIESWIEAGRVTVGGRAAKLGDRATVGDEIAVDGRPVKLTAKAGGRVLIYHKPEGRLGTRRDPEGRPK